jgi:predicted unusual protein kinase regulating ubiquinone biosynthesis (AarF/ABC1/UbiB family)
MTDSSGLARTAQILHFLVKYRSAGVFTGLDLDASLLEPDSEPASEGKPAEFAKDLEALGPTFIKIGQALSTRPDMVPAPYLAVLEHMQDEVEPVPFEQIRAAIESQLGVRLNRAFASFDEVPLGSASLAQVHRATLRDGTDVAVKVQRPGIADQVRQDLDALTRLAGHADRITEMGKRVRFSDWVHEFGKALVAELDYRAEAENLERFAEHLQKYPELFVPQPVWDYTATRVLTMQLVTGTKVTELSGLQRTEQDYSTLASALMRGYLDQMFIHGEIHADPHPGNLLVTDDCRLALFDLGMVAHVPPKQRERMLKLLFAAVDGRGEEVANEAIAMGTRLEHFDEERFTRDVGQMVARYAAHGSQSQSEGRLMLEIVRQATACDLRTPAELSLLGKTLLNLEQVSQALDPTLDVKRIVERHLEYVMSQRLRKALSPSNLASELIEVQALLRESPRKVSDILSLLAENKLQVRMTGLEDSHLTENLQKIANRIAAGLVTAALIVASSMMMRIESKHQLLGYPAIALVLFLIGAGLGIAIVLSALLGDHKARPHEERGPR